MEHDVYSPVEGPGLHDEVGFSEQVVIELRGPDGRVKQGTYIGVPWKRLIPLYLKRLLRRRQ